MDGKAVVTSITADGPRHPRGTKVNLDEKNESTKHLELLTSSFPQRERIVKGGFHEGIASSQQGQGHRCQLKEVHNVTEYAP